LLKTYRRQDIPLSRYALRGFPFNFAEHEISLC
jgi:hypothetical protein